MRLTSWPPPSPEGTRTPTVEQLAVAYELAARHSLDIIFLCDHAEGTVHFLNRRAHELLGYTFGESEPLELVRSWIRPEDRLGLEGLTEHLAAVEIGERIETHLVLRHECGTSLTFQGVHTLLEKTPDGAVLRTLTVLQDVTEQHLLFASIERKAHELESILRATPDTFLRLDGGRVVRQAFVGTWNPWGLDPKSMLERSIEGALPPDVLRLLRGPLDSTYAKRELTAEEFLLPNRPEASFEARVLPLLRGEVMLVLGDLRERARAEKEVIEQQAKSIQAAKMASLGLMAAGVAHEINTPLAVITIGADLIQEHLDSCDELDRALLDEEAKSIRSTAARVTQIVRSLKTFARDDEAGELTEVPVAALVEGALALCGSRFAHHGIRLEAPSIDAALSAWTRPGEASQILVNLLGNAFDATEHLADKWVRLTVDDLGAHVAIGVTDSGTGIPRDLRDKLFSLFFTTKEVGKGTGLGLGISRRLAESQGGSLDLDASSPNTRFVLTLRTCARA